MLSGSAVGVHQFPPVVAMAEERSRTPSLDGGSSLDANASSDGLSWQDPAVDDEAEGFGDEVAYALTGPDALQIGLLCSSKK